MSELPIYKIEPSGKGFAIIREDGSRSNGVDYPKKVDAERKLSLLVAFGYCKEKK